MKHEIKVPEVGESITEVVIAEWLKQDGDYVERDEPICEIESEKASFEVPADEAGVLETKANVDDTIDVGAVLAVIDTDAEAPDTEKQESAEAKEEKEPETPKKSKEQGATAEEGKAKVSPVAANILEEAGLSPDKVQGTGVEGKITKADAQKAVEDQKKDGAAEIKEETAAKEKRAKSPAEKEKPQFTAERNVRTERMTTLRKTVAQRLVSAKNDTAMLTTFNDVDMTGVIEARSKYKQLFEEKYGVRLGFMSFFTKACCLALEDFPVVNARLEDNQILYHEFVDIGIAVSTERGLVVPVIRNAEQLSFAEMERRINDLAGKARDNKLAIEEMRGGTFSITNGGVFGSLLSTPILNTPQSAILGMHRIEERPVAIDGQVEVRPMMYVALSYDHRIIDGKESVQFLSRVKELIESPERMLIDV